MSTENGHDETLLGGIGKAPAPTPEEIAALASAKELAALEARFDRASEACDTEDQTDQRVRAGGELVPLLNFKIKQDRLTEVKSKDVEKYSEDAIEASRTRRKKKTGKVRGVDLVRAFFYAENAKMAGFGYPESWTTCQTAARECITLTHDATGICGAWKGGENSCYVTLARFAETATRDELMKEKKAIGADRKLNEVFAGDEELMAQMAEVAKLASDKKAIKKAVREGIKNTDADTTALLVRESFHEVMITKDSRETLLGTYARLDAAKAAAAAAKAAADKAAADKAAAEYAKVVYDGLSTADKAAADKAAAEKLTADKAAADKAAADAADAAEMEFVEHVETMLRTVSPSALNDILTLVNLAIEEQAAVAVETDSVAVPV